MAIQFRCEKCGKLLSVPGGSGGKAAQCPECGHTMSVPAETTSLGDTMPGQRESNAASSSNPYAAPSMEETIARPEYVASGELRPTLVGVSDLFSLTWRTISRRTGDFVLLAVVVIVIEIGFAGADRLMQTIAGVQSVRYESSWGNATYYVTHNSFSLIYDTYALLAWAAAFWLGIGETLCFLKLIRGQAIDYADLFRGGPFFLPCLGVAILSFLAIAGGFLLLIIPGVIVALMLLIPTYFVLDRQAGVFDALGLSRDYMRGNKASAFFFALVLCLIFLVIGMCARSFGGIINMPIGLLACATTYLAVTGQISVIE